MKVQAKKQKTDEKQISYANKKMSKLLEVLQQMREDFYYEIYRYGAIYKYNDERDNVPKGITVMITLNTTMIYSERLLYVWKKRLGAQKYEVGVYQGHPRIYYRIEFNQIKLTQIK